MIMEKSILGDKCGITSRQQQQQYNDDDFDVDNMLNRILQSIYSAATAAAEDLESSASVYGSGKCKKDI